MGRPFAAAVHSCWAEADKIASPPAEQMTPHQSVNDTRAETRHEARRLFQLLSSPTVRQDKARAVDIRCGKRRGSMRSDQASASLYRPPDWPCARLPGAPWARICAPMMRPTPDYLSALRAHLRAFSASLATVTMPRGLEVTRRPYIPLVNTTIGTNRLRLA